MAGGNVLVVKEQEFKLTLWCTVKWESKNEWRDDNDLIECLLICHSQSSDSDYVLESFSDDEGVGKETEAITAGKEMIDGEAVEDAGDLCPEDQKTNSEPSAELRNLLRRRDELERSNKMQEKRHERYQVSGVGNWVLGKVVG